MKKLVTLCLFASLVICAAIFSSAEKKPLYPINCESEVWKTSGTISYWR